MDLSRDLIDLKKFSNVVNVISLLKIQIPTTHLIKNYQFKI